MVNPPSKSRLELDSTVVNIELTLVSIIQGVALFFLTDNARAALLTRHWNVFVYVLAGLCVIFIFWSRSVIHTLTLIKWPLEFGHNFFYIACALGEALLFSRLESPLAWFQLSAAYSGVVWLLFIYDMRLIHARIIESSNAADRALYARARADQLLNIWALVPLLLLLNLGCVFSIWNWPDLFLARAGHICLVYIQLTSFIGYLIYSGHYFKTIAPLLLQSREGLANSENSSTGF
jgi:hypothetical protein